MLPTLLELLQAEWDELEVILNGWEEEDEERRERRVGLERDGGRIDLNTLGPEAWLEFFRFTRSEIDQLVVAMDIPAVVVCDNGVKEPARTALAMLLRRLSYPSRLSDLYQAFGWEPSRVSRVTRTLADYIYRRWCYLLHFDSHRLTPEKLEYFARVIHLKGAPLAICWGFIDGTFEAVARPVRNQRILYNGWKRDHGIKFQTVIGPDGIRAHVYGPVEGRRHDETLYKESGLAHLLDKHSHAPDGSSLVIYGDPAYGLSSHLISPHKGLNLDPEQRTFNQQMSKVREAVEWSFAELGNLFAFLDYSKNLRALLQPVGLLYLVAVLLCNTHTILHGSQISSYFSCLPPTLGEYFHGTMDDALAFLAKMDSWDEKMDADEGIGSTGVDNQPEQTTLESESDDVLADEVSRETEAYMDIVI